MVYKSCFLRYIGEIVNHFQCNLVNCRKGLKHCSFDGQKPYWKWFCQNTTEKGNQIWCFLVRKRCWWRKMLCDKMKRKTPKKSNWNIGGICCCVAFAKQAHEKCKFDSFWVSYAAKSMSDIGWTNFQECYLENSVSAFQEVFIELQQVPLSKRSLKFSQ